MMINALTQGEQEDLHETITTLKKQTNKPTNKQKQTKTNKNKQQQQQKTKNKRNKKID